MEKATTAQVVAAAGDEVNAAAEVVLVVGDSTPQLPLHLRLKTPDSSPHLVGSRMVVCVSNLVLVLNFSSG